MYCLFVHVECWAYRRQPMRSWRAWCTSTITGWSTECCARRTSCCLRRYCAVGVVGEDEVFVWSVMCPTFNLQGVAKLHNHGLYHMTDCGKDVSFPIGCVVGVYCVLWACTVCCGCVLCTVCCGCVLCVVGVYCVLWACTVCCGCVLCTVCCGCVLCAVGVYCVLWVCTVCCGCVLCVVGVNCMVCVCVMVCLSTTHAVTPGILPLRS